MSTIEERFDLNHPVLLTRGKLLVAGTIMGIGLAGTIIAIAIIALKINEIQQEEIHNNTRAIGNVRRIQRLERPPTERQLALAAATALRACARDAACRNQFRLVVLRAEVKTHDLPNLGPLTKRLRHATGGSSGSSLGSGGSSPGSTGGESGGSGSGGTVRPPARRSPSASAPAPRPSAPSGPPSPPAAPTEPPAAPTESPAAPIPKPPVGVQVPPVPPLPPVPPVCTPVLGVNCPR